MKTVLKIISISIPILLTISQYIPSTSGFWTTLGSDRQINVSLISFYFLLLGLALYLEISSYHDENFKEIKNVTNKVINNTTSKLISDKDFYSDFSYRMEKAQSVVSICYLAPYPPTYTNHEERKEYYKRNKKIIKSKKLVNFKRIVRNTPENLVWVKDLIEAFENEPNFHLAIIEDSKNSKMPLSLSVQIIDKDHTWFVAIEDHERTTHYRDLYVDGESCATAMQGYFNRLWQKSEPIIESGVLTKKGLEIQNQT